jgi:hypothetical protein
MRMAIKKTKKTKKQKPKAPEAPKPTIPNEILKAFLDERVTSEDSVNVTQVTDKYLWESKDLQRYRVNVWMREEVENMYCDKHYIGYSWFLHYEPSTKTIIDKTIEPKPDDERKSIFK